MMQPAKRAVAAGIKKAVIAGDQVAVKLGLTQSPK
jgi:hypothetical protein